MKNLQQEYNRLKKRLDMVSHPNYMITLKKQVLEADETIKQLRKEKKGMEVQQFRRERKMDKIIKHDEPEYVKRINDTAKELEVVAQKTRKLKEKKLQLEEFKCAQEDQMQKLDVKLQQVMKVAQKYGLNDQELQQEEKQAMDQQKEVQKMQMM